MKNHHFLSFWELPGEFWGHHTALKMVGSARLLIFLPLVGTHLKMGLQYLKMEHFHENWWKSRLFVEVNGFKPWNFRISHIQIRQTLLQRMAMSPFQANLEPTRSNKSHCSATTCHLASHLRPVQQQNQPWLPGFIQKGIPPTSPSSGEIRLNYVELFCLVD